MKIENLKDIGKLISDTRKGAGYRSQTQAAKKIDITQPALSFIETGVTNVSINMLIAIARAFGKRLYISFK